MTTTTHTAQAKVLPMSTRKVTPNKTPGLGVQLLTAGSAACVADLITFPLDTAKVRLQVKNIIFQSFSCASDTPISFLSQLIFTLKYNLGARRMFEQCLFSCPGTAKLRRRFWNSKINSRK